jgi:hypothetical protein
VNGARSGLVIAGLAAAGFLLTMPGAQTASAGDISGGRETAVVAVATYRQAVAGRYGDQFPGSAYARNGVASVMPRGGDGQAQAPIRREFDWIPLLIVGGLLSTAVGAYLLYSVRRTA